MAVRSGRAVGGPPEQAARHAALARLIDRRGHCRLAYEPIADLVRGVVCGYEAVVRRPGEVDPAAWRVEATRRGLEPDLDAWVVGSVLHARECLPRGCFLSFNVGAETLLREPVLGALTRARRLDGLVLELSSRVPPRDAPRLCAVVATLRDAGAKVAVDDVGRGAATLQHVIALRPEFVKFAPRLVAGVHRDDVRRAILETLGQLASRLDAWVVAQGVAQIEELDALMGLRVPLAQGPLIGVRAKTLTPVAFALSAYVREHGAARADPGALLALLERAPALAHAAPRDAIDRTLDAHPALPFVPLLDAHRRPVALVERAAHARGEPPAGAVLSVVASARIPEVAERAMLRPPATRFHPVLCCDVRGRYVGLVRVERITAALARACGRD